MTGLLAETRKREIEHIARSAFAGEVITVSAENGEEAIAAARLALGSLPASARAAAVDCGRCESTRAFALATAQAAVGLYLRDSVWLEFPPEARPGFARAGLIELGDQLGGSLVDAVSHPEGLAEDWERRGFGEAVDAITRIAATHDTVVAFLGADELVTGSRRSARSLENVDDLLWTLRARLQHSVGSLGVIFAGGEATEDLTSSDDAAFLGWGTTVSLAPPAALAEDVGVWFGQQEVEDEVTRLWAQEIEAMAGGSVLLAEQLAELTLLERANGSPSDAATSSAWARLANLSEAQLRATVRGLRAIDRLALPVAVALANDRPPYSVDKYASGPNRALRALRGAGFVVQRRPREWRLVDPLLSAWLRTRRVSGRYQLGRPTIYVLRRAEDRFEVLDAPSLTRVRSVHPTIDEAHDAASSLADDAQGADIQTFDVEDRADLPRWARADL
jgi:hypothetical protein